jgi:hypothetical protein
MDFLVLRVLDSSLFVLDFLLLCFLLLVVLGIRSSLRSPV